MDSNKITEKTYVDNTLNTGKGIFVSKKISKGQFIFLIEGPIVKFHVQTSKDSQTGPNWVGYGRNKWIDPSYPANFLNHSCNPSAGIKGARRVYALKNINAGEEVTIDYSTTEEDTLWILNCKCDSTKCRNQIKSIQLIDKKVLKSYLPYIPTYFKRKYVV